MIEPDFCRIMCGSAYLQPRNTLVRLTAISRCHCSSVISCTGMPPMAIAALLTRMSRRPVFSTAAAISPAMSFSCDTSQWR